MHLSPISSYLQSKCSSNTWSGYSGIPGIVILTIFFSLFISSDRTGSLPSFSNWFPFYSAVWTGFILASPFSLYFLVDFSACCASTAWYFFLKTFKNLIFFLLWISVAKVFMFCHCFRHCTLANSSSPNNSSAKFQNYKPSKLGACNMNFLII